MVVCCADNLSSKAGACARYEWRSGPQPLSGRYEVLSNSYFFFFLADFFFFAFFAFLAMLPSVTPKLAQCKSTSTCIHSEYTTISKLIPSASNKVNDRHIVAACGTGRSCRVMHGHVAPCWIKRAEVLMWSEVDDGEAAVLQVGLPMIQGAPHHFSEKPEVRERVPGAQTPVVPEPILPWPRPEASLSTSAANVPPRPSRAIG